MTDINHIFGLDKNKDKEYFKKCAVWLEEKEKEFKSMEKMIETEKNIIAAQIIICRKSNQTKTKMIRVRV